MNAFRAWEDVGIGAEKIGSPNTMSKTFSPHNRDLIVSVETALAELARLTRKGGTRSAPASDKKAISAELLVSVLKRENADLKAAMGNLVRDWHSAQHELKDLQKRAERWDQERAALIEEISRLRSEIADRDRSGLRIVDPTR